MASDDLLDEVVRQVFWSHRAFTRDEVSHFRQPIDDYP